MNAKIYGLTLSALLLCVQSFAAEFKSGNEKIISTAVNDNLYIAGNSVTIDAVIYGDLIGAGGIISVNDTVYEDLILAGGDILINAWIGDDARLFGQNIKVLQSINGDLIVCGSVVHIQKDVVINGDLVILGGYVVINGTINGNIKAIGGRVVFNGNAYGAADFRAEELEIKGTIEGSVVMAAQTIQLGSQARFRDGVEYWRKDGKMDFGNTMVAGEAIYNSEFEIEKGGMDWKHFGLGLVTFWILYTLSVFLMLILIVLLFHKIFSDAGERINTSYGRNFGYGALYFIGLPLLTFFFLATIIGIPIGLALLSLLGVSLLFANTITAVVLAYGINVRSTQCWNKWQIIAVAAVLFLVLKLVALIPFIGLLLVIVVVGMAFGSLIQPYLPWGQIQQKNKV